MADVKEVLSFITEWKSNRQIKEEFKLSQNEFFRLSRWLIKANLVMRCTAFELKRKCNGRITFYKQK